MLHVSMFHSNVAEHNSVQFKMACTYFLKELLIRNSSLTLPKVKKLYITRNILP